jgi:hypothetical protein
VEAGRAAIERIVSPESLAYSAQPIDAEVAAEQVNDRLQNGDLGEPGAGTTRTVWNRPRQGVRGRVKARKRATWRVGGSGQGGDRAHSAAAASVEVTLLIPTQSFIALGAQPAKTTSDGFIDAAAAAAAAASSAAVSPRVESRENRPRQGVRGRVKATQSFIALGAQPAKTTSDGFIELPLPIALTDAVHDLRDLSRREVLARRRHELLPLAVALLLTFLRGAVGGDTFPT